MDFLARANWWVSSLSQTCLKRESSVSPSMTFAIWGVREIGRRSCSTTLGGEHFGTRMEFAFITDKLNAADMVAVGVNSLCQRLIKSTAGKKIGKTRRISLGLMQYSKKRNKYVSVRYSKGGGTRLIDVPLSMTKEELIKEGKVSFFQNGVCPLEAESDMIFELVNFKGEAKNTLKERNGGALPFTVQRYFEFYKLSKVQLYIACRPLVDDDSDDGELMTSPFSASDREDLVDKGKQSSFPSAASTSSSKAASSASSGSPPAASSASTASSIAASTARDRDSSCWFTSRLDDERRHVNFFFINTLRLFSLKSY